MLSFLVYFNQFILIVTKFYLFQSESDKKLVDKVNKLMAILGGETTIALHLEFLIRNNHADLLILKNTKVALRIVLHACTCLTCIVFDVVN